MKVVITVALMTSPADKLFRNIVADSKYESSSDEDEKEDGTPILPEASLTRM